MAVNQYRMTQYHTPHFANYKTENKIRTHI